MGQKISKLAFILGAKLSGRVSMRTKSLSALFTALLKALALLSFRKLGISVFAIDRITASAHDTLL